MNIVKTMLHHVRTTLDIFTAIYKVVLRPEVFHRRNRNGANPLHCSISKQYYCHATSLIIAHPIEKGKIWKI